MDNLEKKRQIEEAYKELEEKELEEFLNSDFHEELYDDDYYDISMSDSDYEKIDLIRKLLYYERLGMYPTKKVDGNSSIEELENAIEELEWAVSDSWDEYENRKWREEGKKYYDYIDEPRYSDINEEDIMNAIMGGYGDVLGY